MVAQIDTSTAEKSRIFTARRDICCRRRACLRVYPSHAGIVSKRLNLGSRKQRHTIAQRF